MTDDGEVVVHRAATVGPSQELLGSVLGPLPATIIGQLWVDG